MPAEAADVLKTVLADGVLTVTLDNPATMNAIDLRMNRLLAEAFRMAALDSDVRAVIVTGAGRGFCSGGNFKAFGALDEGDPIAVRCSGQPRWSEIEMKARRFESGADSARLLREMGKPTIALITGAAAGAGVGLAAACDFRVASRSASFRPGYMRVGLSPDFGASYYLTHILGSAKALEFLLLTDALTGEEAFQFGLVTRVVEDDQAQPEAMRIARRLADGPPIAIQFTKDAVNAAQSGTLGEVIAIEARNFARCFQSEDVREALTALTEKRPPQFRDSEIR